MIYYGTPVAYEPANTIETPESIQKRLESYAVHLILDEAVLRFGSEKKPLMRGPDFLDS